MRMRSTGTSTATAMRTNPPTTAPAITAILPPPPLLPEELELPAEPPPDEDDEVVVGALGTITGLLTLTPEYPALLSEVLIAATVTELLRLAVSVAVSVEVLMAV